MMMNNKDMDSMYTSKLDRHSLSQGIKLISIGADEYEEGNDSTALNIYLTGIDMIIMALPSKQIDTN